MIPNATVRASTHGSDSLAPDSNARTIGAHPVDWTQTKRGSGPLTQPSSRASVSALWIPIIPTPPPVG